MMTKINFHLKLWDNNLNQEKHLKIEGWIEGSGTYFPNLISITESVSVSSNISNPKEIVRKFD